MFGKRGGTGTGGENGGGFKQPLAMPEHTQPAPEAAPVAASSSTVSEAPIVTGGADAAGVQEPVAPAPQEAQSAQVPKKIKTTVAPPMDYDPQPAQPSAKSEEYYDVKTQVFAALIDTIDLSQLSKLDNEGAREEIRDIVNDIVAIKSIVR